MPDDINLKYAELLKMVEAVENPNSLPEVQRAKDRLIAALGAISAGPYTPAVLTDWNGSADPGNVDNALDQLAERVTDIEDGSTTVDASNVTYTPAELNNYSGGVDPGNADDALDQLALRTTSVEALIAALISSGGNNPSTITQLVSGGELIWEQDLDFTVTAALYFINGVLYTSDEQQVTLNDGDEDDPRIDIVVLDTTGTAVVIEGTPAADPAEPPLDPATQIQVGFVFVDEDATEPVVTKATIYSENAGEPNEFTMSVSGAGIVTNSTNNPRNGSVVIEATNMANNAYFQAKDDAAFDVNTYGNLIFYIRSKSTWNQNRGLRIQFQINGVKRGSSLTLAHGYHGFDSSNVTDYQGIVIPISSFNVPTGSLIDEIRFIDFGGAIGFYVDDISLQSSDQIVIIKPPGVVTPGSPIGSIQFNQGGGFAGNPNLTFDATNKVLNLLGRANVETIAPSIRSIVPFQEITMTGTLTLVAATSIQYLALDPDGSPRDVELPPEANGLSYVLANVGTGTITVKNDAAGTEVEIEDGEVATLISGASSWPIKTKGVLV